MTRSDHNRISAVRSTSYKTEVLAVITVARLHSPATSNDQHSSHLKLAQWPREKFHRLWKRNDGVVRVSGVPCPVNQILLSSISKSWNLRDN